MRPRATGEAPPKRALPRERHSLQSPEKFDSLDMFQGQAFLKGDEQSELGSGSTGKLNGVGRAEASIAW